MAPQLDWLPPLVLFSDYHGDWEEYIEILYKYFAHDFVDSCPIYRGIRLGLKRHPMVDGKEITFWHLISIGEDEQNRLPEIRRCEHIRWSRPIIEHSEETEIKVWENDRKGQKGICLFLESNDYLVVLRKRDNYILFWTAYPILEPHQKRKLLKEYDEYIHKKLDNTN